MRIIIPTYQRTQLLKEKTLAYLQRSGWPAADTIILVADDAEEEAYARVLAETEDAWADSLRITAPGLVQSRAAAIQQYLEAGEEILWIDDDVEGIYRYRDAKNADWTPIQVVGEEGFGIARDMGAYLWGIYPTLNPFYMKNKVRAGLWHVVGCFYGQTIRHDDSLELSYGDAKEDYERTLRHWERDGFVMRLDYFAPKTVYYKASGGISNRTAESVMANVVALQSRWPGKVQLNPKRKSGYPEILLREK